MLCTASVDDKVPAFLEGKGKGWLTAEYQMHPRANPRRQDRDGRGKAPGGRTQEIQRLVGRALRAAVDLRKLGARTITIDCDVLEADGGTRTASVTGGFVALALALAKVEGRARAARAGRGDERRVPRRHRPRARPLLPRRLDGRVDLNVVATATRQDRRGPGHRRGRAGRARRDVDAMVDLALAGIEKLAREQRAVLAAAGVDLAALACVREHAMEAG